MSTCHLTQWDKVTLFNFRNVFAQTNDKCHVDLWCINCNNFFRHKLQGWAAKSTRFLSWLASTKSYSGKTFAKWERLHHIEGLEPRDRQPWPQDSRSSSWHFRLCRRIVKKMKGWSIHALPWSPCWSPEQGLEYRIKSGGYCAEGPCLQKRLMFRFPSTHRT